MEEESRGGQAASTSTGMPLTTALFEGVSSNVPGVSTLLQTPACSRAT